MRCAALCCARTALRTAAPPLLRGAWARRSVRIARTGGRAAHGALMRLRARRAALPQSSFLQGLLGPLCTIDLEFAAGSGRAPVTVKGESGKPETLPLYTANDTVRGQARRGARAPYAALASAPSHAWRGGAHGARGCAARGRAG